LMIDIDIDIDIDIYLAYSKLLEFNGCVE